MLHGCNKFLQGQKNAVADGNILLQSAGQLHNCSTSLLTPTSMQLQHLSFEMDFKSGARSHLCSLTSATLASATLVTHERSSLLTVAFPEEFDGNIVLAQQRLDLSRFYERCDGLHWYAGCKFWRCKTGAVAKLQRWQPNLRDDCKAILDSNGNILLRTGNVIRAACKCFALATSIATTEDVVLVNRDDTSRVFVIGCGSLVDAL